jgi:hypothetical protein
MSRYWSALLAGAPAAELTRLRAQLDPEIRAVMDGMLAMRADVAPAPDFVARLEQALTTARPTVDRDPTEARSGPRSTQPGDVARTPPPLRGRAGRILPVVGTAILVLALLGGILAVRRPDGGAPNAVVQAPTGVPATPAPELGTATLLDVGLPATVIPAADELSGLAYFHVAPNTSGEWFGSCCPGLMVEHVLAGTISFTSAQSARVLRADGTQEEVAADAAVALGPGDTLLARNEAHFTAANPGSVPVEMVEWLYIASPDSQFAGHNLPGWGGPGGLDARGTLPAFAGPIRATLRRLVLAPGEGQSPFRPDGLRHLVVSDVEAEIVRVFGEGDFVAVDSQGKTTTVYTLEIVPLDASTDDVPIVGLPPS